MLVNINFGFDWPRSFRKKCLKIKGIYLYLARGQGQPTLWGHFFKNIRLRERLHTHKSFTKDQCFYLNYRKFSLESYVLDVY